MTIQKKYFWTTIIANALFYVIFIIQYFFNVIHINIELNNFFGHILAMLPVIILIFILIAFVLGIVFLFVSDSKRYIIYGLLINLFTITLVIYILLNLHGGYG